MIDSNLQKCCFLSESTAKSISVNKKWNLSTQDTFLSIVVKGYINSFVGAYEPSLLSMGCSDAYLLPVIKRDYLAEMYGVSPNLF